MLDINYEKIIKDYNIKEILSNNFINKLNMSQEDAESLAESIIDKSLSNTQNIMNKAMYEMASKATSK